MISVQRPNLAEASSIVRAPIIHEFETTVLTNSLETLLKRERQVGKKIGQSIFAALNRPDHDNLQSNRSTQTNKRGNEYADI
jgi:hypothetical protein